MGGGGVIFKGCLHRPDRQECELCRVNWDRVVCELAVLKITEIATMGMLAAQVGLLSVDAIKDRCRVSSYWPAFCRAVIANQVPGGFLPGALGNCVVGWARADVELLQEVTESPSRTGHSGERMAA